MQSLYEELGGTYRQVGDYFIPDKLHILPPVPSPYNPILPLKYRIAIRLWASDTFLGPKSTYISIAASSLGQRSCRPEKECSIAGASPRNAAWTGITVLLQVFCGSFHSIPRNASGEIRRGQIRP